MTGTGTGTGAKPGGGWQGASGPADGIGAGSARSPSVSSAVATASASRAPMSDGIAGACSIAARAFLSMVLMSGATRSANGLADAGLVGEGLAGAPSGHVTLSGAGTWAEGAESSPLQCVSGMGGTCAASGCGPCGSGGAETSPEPTIGRALSALDGDGDGDWT